MDTSKNGSIILPPHKDNWTTEDNPPVVISLVRRLLFTWGASNLLGYIEIQQPYSLIEDICDSSGTENSKIIVKSNEGAIIYPYDLNQQDYIDYYFDMSNDITFENTFIAENPQNGEQELIYKNTSSITGWTILQILPTKDFMAPIYKIQRIIIIAGITLVFVTLFIIYLITNSVTKPIKYLRQSLKKVTLQNPLINIDFQSNNNEIALLNLAFNKTIQRLHEAMNQTIQARSKEIEAHFLALQAQMDPHFLYNSLMGISAAGQEYENYKVVDMCTLLSNMLRYTASYDTSIVSLSDEIKHAENYMSMLKLRYEHAMAYEFNIENAMRDIKVPKLILQPLIENSFSHGFANIKPPYHLIIEGNFSDSLWTVSVCDNGSGFSPDAIKNIYSQINKYNDNLRNNDYVNTLQIGGMAIFNIYVRLKILYGEHVIFNLSNNNERGATVTIGSKRA